MLSTIWTWTQEWSDIPSRSETDLGHVPPGAELGVGVDPLEQRLEPPVAAGRRADPRLGDRPPPGRRLARRARGALGPVAFTRPVSRHAELERSSRSDFGRDTLVPIGRCAIGEDTPESGITIPECSCSACWRRSCRYPALRAAARSVGRRRPRRRLRTGRSRPWPRIECA